MNTKELRLGNLVERDGTAYKVIAIDEFRLAVEEDNGEEYDWHNNAVSPIPISTDWLKKFGFYGKYRSCGYVYRKDSVILTSQDEDDEGNEIEDYTLHFHLNYGGLPVYYVHQLQNAFYYATGKEL